MSDLKPCPFCGGEARKDEADDGGKFIECSTCSACTALHYDRAENLESAWNSRRGAEGALREMREALEFYANPEVYKPHPHGHAFDDRDLSFIARNALDRAEEAEG